MLVKIGGDSEIKNTKLLPIYYSPHQKAGEEIQTYRA
jgi:hypothetical protein